MGQNEGLGGILGLKGVKYPKMAYFTPQVLDWAKIWLYMLIVKGGRFDIVPISGNGILLFYAS